MSFLGQSTALTQLSLASPTPPSSYPSVLCSTTFRREQHERDPGRSPGRQRALRRRVRRQGRPADAAGPALRHPHLHGRPARSGQVRRPAPRATPTSSATPAAAPATTRSARSSSRTSCSARASGSSSTTPTAAWSSSPTRSCAACWRRAWKTAALGRRRLARRRRRPGLDRGRYINWLTISDLAQSVVDDVRRIRTHPLVPGDIPIYGYIYDVKTRPPDRGAGGDARRGGDGSARLRGRVEHEAERHLLRTPGVVGAGA